MTNRSANGNAIDGTLSYTTRLRMKFQGFKICLMIALIFGSITVIGLFLYKPPKPVKIPELGPSVQLGLYDLVTWELANKKIAFFKFPPVLFTVVDLPEDEREAGMALVYEAVWTYGRQYLKFLYAFLGGSIFAYIGAVINGRQEARAKTEDKYIVSVNPPPSFLPPNFPLC